MIGSVARSVATWAAMISSTAHSHSQPSSSADPTRSRIFRPIPGHFSLRLLVWPSIYRHSSFFNDFSSTRTETNQEHKPTTRPQTIILEITTDGSGHGEAFSPCSPSQEPLRRRHLLVRLLVSVSLPLIKIRALHPASSDSDGGAHVAPRQPSDE